jgi:enoyl-CoA hydratase/carnithine racemase
MHNPLAADAPVLLREDAGGIATLTLNRGGARNALSVALMAALQAQLDDIGADETVKVVVLRGAGPAFCAGHDLKEMRAGARGAMAERVFSTCARLMLSIAHLRQPVIAQVHGVATAAGCQLVATCDLAVCDERATFATPGVNIGLFCSTPMVAVSRAVGRKSAMELLLLGDAIDAAEALRIGLVNRVVPEDALGATVADIAARIVAKSGTVVALGKAAFAQQAEMGLADAYAYTAKVMTQNLALPDAAEGIDAFLERRPPRWES